MVTRRIRCLVISAIQPKGNYEGANCAMFKSLCVGVYIYIYIFHVHIGCRHDTPAEQVKFMTYIKAPKLLQSGPHN